MAIETALATGGLSLLGTGINAWMTYRGAERAEEAHKESIAKQEQIFERQFSEEKKQFKSSQRLQRESLDFQKNRDAFNRRQTFVNNYLTMLNSNPNVRLQTLAAARGRR